MSKIANEKIGLIIIGIFITLFVCLLFSFSGESRNSYLVKEGNKPQNLSAFYKLLDRTYKLENIEGDIKDFFSTADTSGLLLAIADSIYISEDNSLKLLEYIRKGGEVLFVSRYITKDLESLIFHPDDYLDFSMEENISNHFFVKTLYSYPPEDYKVSSKFIHPTLDNPTFNITIPNNYYISNYDKRYNFISSDYFLVPTTYNILPLASISSTQNKNENDLGDFSSNFVSFSIGNGHLYYHLQPELFSNYFLTQKEHLTYLNSIFAHFDKDKIYWLSDVLRNPSKENIEAKDLLKAPTMSSMEFIYQETQLRNAWYVMLIAGVLFIVFKGKRKQRVVPVLQKVENNSHIFISNIANLYHKTYNYGNIAAKLSSNFILDLNNRLHLDLKKDEAISQIQSDKIAKSTGINHQNLDQLVQEYNKLLKSRFSSFTEDKLHKLYNVIQKYYQLEQQVQELLMQ